MSTPAGTRQHVVGVAIVRNGHLAMLRRTTDAATHGQWCDPGGKLDPGEAIVDAACREAIEETGLRIDPASVREIFETDVDLPHGSFRVTIVEATAASGHLAVCEPTKHSEARWVPLAEVPTLDVTPATRAFVQSAAWLRLLHAHGIPTPGRMAIPNSDVVLDLVDRHLVLHPVLPPTKVGTFRFGRPVEGTSDSVYLPGGWRQFDDTGIWAGQAVAELTSAKTALFEISKAAESPFNQIETVRSILEMFGEPATATEPVNGLPSRVEDVAAWARPIIDAFTAAKAAIAQIIESIDAGGDAAKTVKAIRRTLAGVPAHH